MKPFNQNKKQVMDGFCPVSCSGWSTPHALTDPTYLSCATGGKSADFSPPQKYLKPQEWLENQISFYYKKKPQPINEHETSELKCTDPSEAGDEESRLEVMFAQ